MHYHLDDIFNLLTSDIWIALTPYREGVPLLSNGNTYPYDRNSGKILINKEGFADCVEISIRHLTNIFLYNFLQKNFDLSHIKKHMENKNNPYFKNFVDFYEQVQTPDLANSGDIEMRSLWNTVVGGLNQENDPVKIIYKRDGANEIKSGFINLMKVFQKIFSLELEKMPDENTEKKKVWLKSSFATLLTTLNPTKNYEIELNLSESNNELFGDLDVKVTDYGSNKVYSFRLYAGPGHTTLGNLQYLTEKKDTDYKSILRNQPLSDLNTNTALESLWVLAPQALRESKIKNPWYELFQNSLEDNDSKINFLEKFEQNYEVLKKDFFKKEILQAILQNILDEISWEDDYVQEKILPILGKLMQKEEFIPEILSQSVRGLKIPDSFSEIDITECGKFYKNLEFLTLNTKLAKINVGDFKKLKKLSVMDQQAKAIEGLDQLFELEELNLEKATSLQGDFYLGELGKLRTFLLQSANIRYVGLWQLPEITELNLNNMSSLREMDMDDMEKLTKLSCEKSGIQSVNFLSNMPHLKNISFRNSEIAKIDGLEKLSQLENLNFEDTPNLTNISLKGLFSLKTLSFGNSAIAIINDLEELSQLEDLNLRNTKKLTNISLKGLSNLKKFSCFYSKLENIEDISGFSNLEYISVENTKNLNELSLKDLPNLKFLILNGSNIKTLSLENIDLLSNLDLSNLVLKSLVFRGALKNMDKVFLRNAYELESLTGLDNLTNLGILELTDTEKLLSLEFKKDNKMLKLYLRGSLISKDTIKGLEHLDEKNISTSY